MLVTIKVQHAGLSTDVELSFEVEAKKAQLDFVDDFRSLLLHFAEALHYKDGIKALFRIKDAIEDDPLDHELKNLNNLKTAPRLGTADSSMLQRACSPGDSSLFRRGFSPPDSSMFQCSRAPEYSMQEVQEFSDRDIVLPSSWKISQRAASTARTVANLLRRTRLARRSAPKVAPDAGVATVFSPVVAFGIFSEPTDQRHSAQLRELMLVGIDSEHTAQLPQGGRAGLLSSSR
ncbi:unnamed protein product [Polarella glacialis]|uniref:Uncharacterized protein n=1 Tax=Polarella glacialis TaxID=89957 RepID=A0A813LVT1_POLGL|nr:unnamed protein product [Polarella glacialis]